MADHLATSADPIVGPAPGGSQRSAGKRAAEASRALAFNLRTFLFIAAHVPLAIIANRVPAVATALALATFVVGMALALAGRSPVRVAQAVFYIAGAEVMWRMSHAAVLWEYGKYASCAIMIAAGLRSRPRRSAAIAIVYFVLLLPSVAMTLFDQPLDQARKGVSFNLSGPLSLAVTGWFFSRVQLRRAEVHRALSALLAPAAGIATITAFTTITVEKIAWMPGSNLVTSGNFGPNQVSTILGGAAFLAFVLLVDGTAKRASRAVLFALVAFFLVQSALTFSRSGLYLAVTSSAAAGLFLVSRGRRRLRLVFAVLALVAMAKFLVVPELDSFTRGTLSTRFKDTSSTNRDKIVLTDLKIFAENPVLGVGPGQAMLARLEYMDQAASHTEYSRLLVEHGVLGIGALACILVMAWGGFRSNRTPRERALVAGALTWGLLFLLTNGMRLFCPALFIGFASFVTLVPEEADGPAPKHPSPRAQIGP